MVINEVRFAPMTSDAPRNITPNKLGEFKYQKYLAYLPPRNANEIVMEVSLNLLNDNGRLFIYIHHSFFGKKDDGYMKGIWHWDKEKVYTPAPASIEEVQLFLSEIGYEVHKITLLEND